MTKSVFDSYKKHHMIIIFCTIYMTKTRIYDMFFTKNKDRESIFFPRSLHNLHVVIADIWTQWLEPEVINFYKHIVHSLYNNYIIFLNSDQGEALYIIRSLPAVYHQREALHGIKPQEIHAYAWWDTRAARRPWWYAPHFARWRYAKPTAWIKKEATFV